MVKKLTQKVNKNGVTLLRHEYELNEGGQYTYDFPIPVAIPGGSDIDIRAKARTNNAKITVAFDMILIS